MKVFIPYDADLLKKFMGKEELDEEQLALVHDAVWSKLFHPAICDQTFKAIKLCRPGFEEEMKENDRLIAILNAQEKTIEHDVDGTRCETEFTREQFEKHVFDQAHEHWVGVISNGKHYKKDPDPQKEEANRIEAEEYAKSYSERGIAIVSELRKRVQYTEKTTPLHNAERLTP